MQKKLSLARLRNDARSGKMTLEMLVRLGEPSTDENTPERLKGIRKVVGANTVAVKLLTADGSRESELRIERASLTEYDGETLSTFYPGRREMTPEEKKVMLEWKAVEDDPEYQERLKWDCLTDGSSCWWKKKSFFEKAGMTYLLGYEKVRGMKLDSRAYYEGEEKCVVDDSVKGPLMMKYKVRFV